MIFKGFRFGMILQIAIGPVCLYIFKTATEWGILAAESGVLAATLMDAVFVTLAIIGIGTLLEKPKVKFFMKYFGTIILVYFGLGVIISTFGIHIIPSFANNDSRLITSNVFITTFILTASSPLSILFWTGVFASKVSEEGFGRKNMILFGIGAVLATLIFLGIFAFITGLLNLMKIPDVVISVLNILVGLIIIGFGVKLLLNKLPGVEQTNVNTETYQ